MELSWVGIFMLMEQLILFIIVKVGGWVGEKNIYF